MSVHYSEKIINQELVFKTNTQLEALTFSDVDFWTFSFLNDIYVTIEGTFWRLLKNNKILAVSFDHQQQFGLPKPIDVVEKVTDILKGKILTEIKVKEDTGDLVLSISDNITVEVFITSSGFESYSFGIENKTYVGLGSGEIAMYSIK